MQTRSVEVASKARQCEWTYVRLHSPIPIKLQETRMFVKVAAVPSTHVSVANHPALPNADSPEVLKAVHESPFVDPIRQRPVLLRHNFVITLCRRQVLGRSL